MYFIDSFMIRWSCFTLPKYLFKLIVLKLNFNKRNTGNNYTYVCISCTLNFNTNVVFFLGKESARYMRSWMNDTLYFVVSKHMKSLLLLYGD